MATPDTPSRGVKRKRTDHSLEFKIKVLKEVDKKLKLKKEICADFEISGSTLSTFIKDREKIEKAFYSSTFQPDRKRMRQIDDDRLKVEQGLLSWFAQARDSNIPISGEILLEIAQGIAQELGIDFEVNASWIQRVKERHGISYKLLCGEAASVPEDLVTPWVQKTLPDILAKYAPEDCFNVDETGLFYRCLPNRTHAFKGDTCSGGKQSKERLTLLLGSNMTGTQKLPPFVIGKSENPRCFKNAKSLPVAYKANKRAWMTSILFVEWLQKLDRQMRVQNRKIAMFIDNCPAHPQSVKLTNIDLFFFPPNCTSKVQPMDQGVIANFKCYYRKMVLQKLIIAFNATPDEEKKAFPTVYKLSVLDALYTVRAAWGCVSDETIANCFRHAGFGRQTTQQSADCTHEAAGLSAVYTQASQALGVCPTAGGDKAADDFFAVDEGVITTEILSAADIASMLTQKKEGEEEDSEEEEEQDVEPRKPPSSREAAEGLEVIKAYAMSQESTTSETFDLIEKLELFFRDSALQAHKQSTITGLFKKL